MQNLGVTHYLVPEHRGTIARHPVVLSNKRQNASVVSEKINALTCKEIPQVHFPLIIGGLSKPIESRFLGIFFNIRRIRDYDIEPAILKHLSKVKFPKKK